MISLMVMMVYGDIGIIFYSKQVVTSAKNNLCMLTVQRKDALPE